MTAPVPGPPAGSASRLAEALTALDGIAERPVHEHVERFDALHRSMQDALATLDEV